MAIIIITKFKKSSYLYIGHYIDLVYWDEVKNVVKQSHSNAARLKNFLLIEVAETNRFLLKLQAEGRTFLPLQMPT